MQDPSCIRLALMSRAGSMMHSVLLTSVWRRHSRALVKTVKTVSLLARGSALPQALVRHTLALQMAVAARL